MYARHVYAMCTERIPPRSPVLDAADRPEETKQALQSIDASMFRWHRALVKGEVTRSFLDRAGLDLETAQFQGLMAVMRISRGVGRDAPEAPTVGVVAEDMAIDPSRASRICSALITKGYLRREAMQDDGRKSILVLTDMGRETFSRIWALKWEETLDGFSDWSDEDIATFDRLLSAFVTQRLAD